MCNPMDDSSDGFCEKFKLAIKLEKLISAVTTQDQHGVSFVRVQHIKNLIDELECENV